MNARAGNMRRGAVLVQAFLWGIALSYGFSDWTSYREALTAHPDAWRMYLTGGIEAPFQYRVGSWVIVDWMQRLFHARPYDTLALLDVVCLAASLWLVLHVLRNLDGFPAQPASLRWLGYAIVLLVEEYFVAWGHWFQSAETMPSILFVALSVALAQGKLVKNGSLACLLLVLLAAVQGFFRADVAVILHAGCLLAILCSRKLAAPLGRAQQGWTSLLAAFAAGCVQLYLMLVRFPQAKYGPSGPVRLMDNLQPEMWLTMLLALLPYGLLLGLWMTRRYRPDATTWMLLAASLLYLPLWATVGLVDEVRIFLPFSFALAPALAMALLTLLATDTGAAKAPTSG